MNDNKRIWMGVLAIAPLGLTVLGMLGARLFGLGLLAIPILSIVAVVVFIVDLFHNPNVQRDHQVAWLVGMLLFGTIVTPIYWYVAIWRDEYGKFAALERELT